MQWEQESGFAKQKVVHCAYYRAQKRSLAENAKKRAWGCEFEDEC